MAGPLVTRLGGNDQRPVLISSLAPVRANRSPPVKWCCSEVTRNSPTAGIHWYVANRAKRPVRHCAPPVKTANAFVD